MSSSYGRKSRWILCVVAACLVFIPDRQVPGQEVDRTQEARAIREQIDALTKKLKSLEETTASKPGEAQPGLKLSDEWLKALNWRSLGPANMGGRIVALSVYEKDPSLFYVATASGGLLKTVNNGISFEHQFDREATVSIGDVCVSQSNPDVVWVGTGESNPRNSVSYGDGVYKSTDGGKTWRNMGLKGSFQVGRILVHPVNPDIVYVGALGRLYGPSEERGLYNSTDGGTTWNKILHVDDRTGIIDIRFKPDDPETLIVATYERERDLYDVNDPSKKYGPGSGLHKTTDGGKTFKRLTAGLPTSKLGRIGLDWSRKNPQVVFAIVECEKIGMGPPGANRDGSPAPYMGITGAESEGEGARIIQTTPDGPAQKAGILAGDVVRALGDEEIKSYPALQQAIRARKVGEKSKIRLEREGKSLELEITFEARPAGGPTGPLDIDPTRPFGGLLGGQIENTQDRQGPDAFEYGGIYKSVDAGESWSRINSLNPRPMYFSKIRVDPSDENLLYVLGIALYRSNDGGKSFRGDAGRNVHSDHHALWIDPRDGRHMILGGDGGIYVSYDRTNTWDHLNHVAIAQFYHVSLDPRMPFKAYGGLQDNGSWGGPGLVRNGPGSINEDWISIGGGDGFKCQVDPEDPDLVYYTSQNGNMGRRHLKTGQSASIRARADRERPNRFNWNTPFLLSKHNSRIFYAAGSYLFKSLNRGDDLRPVSPQITRSDKGSATAIAESPRNPDVLYVGTDDGALWVTRDGTKTWADISAAVGLPKPCYVATIEASRFEEGRAYACFDGHRSDLDDPLIYVTEDFGKSWKPLNANLPRGSTRCLREDLENPNLLWLGTEFGIWASLDRGRYWNSLNTNLPTVAIHEIAQHPVSGEVVVATHGRSLWSLEIAPIRQSTEDRLKEAGYLYRPTPAFRWRPEPRRGGTNRRFEAQNPPSGAQIYYSLSKKAEKVELKIIDFDGTVVRDLRVTNEPGLHRIAWDLTRPAPPRSNSATSTSRSLGNVLSGMRQQFNRATQRPRPVPVGTYRAQLVVDGKELAQPIRVLSDPAFPQEMEVESDVSEFFEDEAESGSEESSPIDN